MKLVIFGLTVTSSWGNGHATLWRALWRAMVRRGHQIVFLERDVPYYAAHRDLRELAGGEIVLYRDWAEVESIARMHIAGGDVAMVTSYCPDAIAATELLSEWDAGVRVFYDLDSPVTLERLAAGERVPYVPPDGLGVYDLVLSYAGGDALRQLRERLNARRVAPLYGSVDPAAHFPVAPVDEFRGDLSYLGTYAVDRQESVHRFFLEPARLAPQRRFMLAGAQYPQDFPWTSNIYFVRHLEPNRHPAFLCSSRLTLNVTRRAMAAVGYCPSGRLFEAAACGVPIISDWWTGLEEFFTPGEELLLARTTDDVLSALDMSDEKLRRLASAARERTLDEHTADRRASELEREIERTAADEMRGVGGVKAEVS